MMDICECYILLGIDEHATDEQVKRAYKHKAKEYHPDNTKSGSAEMFECLKQAHDFVLENKKCDNDPWKIWINSLSPEMKKRLEEMVVEEEERKRKRQFRKAQKEIETRIIDLGKINLSGLKVYKVKDYIGEIVDQKYYILDKKKV